MNSNLVDRIPPQSCEAEQSALGSMLLEREAITIAQDHLTEDDFYREPHKLIYRGICDLYQQQQTVDLITLGEWLKSHEHLDTIGGTLYLTTMMAQVPTAAGIAHYCEIVKTKSVQRQIIKAADEIIADAYVPEVNQENLIAASEAKINSINDRLQHVESAELLQHIAKKVFLRYENEIEAGLTTGFKTSWFQVNRLISHLRPGQVTVIVAQTGVGKTAFGLQMMQHIAGQGELCGVFSMEMLKEELALRTLLSFMQRHSSSELDDMAFCLENKASVMDDMANALEICWDLPLWIDDEPGLTVQEMERRIRRINRERRRPTAAVLIDYVQLAKAVSRGNARHEELGNIIYEIHEMSKRLKLHVIVLSQLNNEGERDFPHTPRLSHIGESKKIGMAAYRVIALYRPEYYGDKEVEYWHLDPNKHAGATRVEVLKQRQGGACQANGKPLTATWLHFDGGNSRYRDWTREEWCLLRDGRSSQ